jgi:hypothetical protein
LEERFEGEVHPNHDILKDLAVDGFKFWVLSFPGLEEVGHLEVGNRNVVMFPSKFTEVYRGIVDKTTDIQGFLEPCDVGLFRV